MSAFLSEYGGVVIIVISISVFFYIFQALVSGTEVDGGRTFSIENTYSADVIDIEQTYSNDVIWDAASGQSFILSPHFTVSDSKDVDIYKPSTYNDMSSYKMPGDVFTRDDAMKIVHAYADEGNHVKIDDKKVVVLVTRYDVEMTTVDEHGNLLSRPMPKYQNYPAIDDYGHLIPGKEISRLVYEDGDHDGKEGTFLGELTNANPIKITSADKDKAILPHFKLVYRVEYLPAGSKGNGKKAEFVTFLVKEALDRVD